MNTKDITDREIFAPMPSGGQGSQSPGEPNRRILIIDDNAAIHVDFKKILGAAPISASELRESERALFGESEPRDGLPEFHLDFAFQGREGAEMIRLARTAGRPYAMAFIDARMPPGWDGIETAAKVWEIDPQVQIVICTAYADYTWEEIRRKLIYPDRLVILKKPFEPIEILQLADALTQKWRLALEDRRRLLELESLIEPRSGHREEGGDADVRRKPVRKREVLDSATAAETQRRRLLTRELGRALQKGDLSVHYQPLVDIVTRRAVSLEALARWTHAELGPISPAEFIPIAEESGLIAQVGEFVLRTVCNQLREWQRQGIPVVPVAVNISAAQLECQEIWKLVRSVLAETGLPPGLLALELTESVLVKNAERHAVALRSLRADGVKIQIDDFGTGYSSLSYLHQLPADTLKIDRSFIQRIDSSSTDEAIVSAILALCRSLGLRAVAEGVETPSQLEALARNGCQVAQGFYFCRPLPAEHCQRLLLDLSRRSSFTDTLRMKLAQDGANRSGVRYGVKMRESA